MPYYLNPYLVNDTVLVYSMEDARKNSYYYNATSLELMPNLKIRNYHETHGHVVDTFGVQPVIFQYESGKVQIVYAPNDSEFVYTDDGHPVLHGGEDVVGKSVINMPDIERSMAGSPRLVPVGLDAPNEESIDRCIELSYLKEEQETDQTYEEYRQFVALPSSQMIRSTPKQPVLPPQITRPFYSAGVPSTIPGPSTVPGLSGSAGFPGSGVGYRSLNPIISKSVVDQHQGFVPPPTPQRTPRRPQPTPQRTQPTPRNTPQRSQPTPQRSHPTPRNTPQRTQPTPRNTPQRSQEVASANAALAQTLNHEAIHKLEQDTMPQITVDMTKLSHPTPTRAIQLEVVSDESISTTKEDSVHSELRDEGEEKRSEIGDVRSPSPRVSHPSPNPSPSPVSENPEIKELKRDIKELRRDNNELRGILTALLRRYYQIYPVNMPSELRSDGQVGTLISVTEAKQKMENGDFVEFLLDPLLQPFVASNRKNSVNRLLTFKSSDGSLYFVRANYDPKTNEFNEPAQ
jgi:hypothetical protein